MKRMTTINLSLASDCLYNQNFERLFALCENCLWSATIFKSKVKKDIITLHVCPECFEEKVLLVPLLYIRLYNVHMNIRAPRKKMEH